MIDWDFYTDLAKTLCTSHAWLFSPTTPSNNFFFVPSIDSALILLELRPGKWLRKRTITEEMASSHLLHNTRFPGTHHLFIFFYIFSMMQVSETSTFQPKLYVDPLLTLCYSSIRLNQKHNDGDATVCDSLCLAFTSCAFWQPTS